MKNLVKAMAAVSVATLLTACPAPSSNQVTTNPTAQPTNTPSGTTTGGTNTGATTAGGSSSGGVNTGAANYVQVERLARPAINEGLLTSNNLLNLFNMVPPSVDATAAAAPIAAEATKTLKALGNSDAEVAALFKALLPDVMRIDTTRQSGYAGTSAAAFGNLTASLRPIGGRMITDDVMDATLTLIVPGGAAGKAPKNLTSDGVTYAGPNANGKGHKPVLSDFPYLAAPN